MNRENPFYKSISDYYKEKYNGKVYKLPIHLPLSCPNRDGSKGTGGCIFCGDTGGSFEMLSKDFSITTQLERNKKHIEEKYHADKFIAYFMNYSNTYMPFNKFKEIIDETIKFDIVGINISTRPDMIFDDQLEYLDSIDMDNNDITFELGLQTVNTTTLQILNRCHSLADYIHGCINLKKYNFRIATHFILDMPWDSEADVKEAAEICNVLKIDEVKIHSLYVLKNTILGNKYLRGEFNPLSEEEYLKRVAIFLNYLNPEISISRIVGRAPEEYSLMVNWDKSWWKVRDDLYDYMKETNSYQGKLYKKKGGTSYGEVHFR